MIIGNISIIETTKNNNNEGEKKNDCLAQSCTVNDLDFSSDLNLIDK